MATSKLEWLCIIPDFPNVLEKRMAVRAQHFEDLRSKPFLKFGGGTMAEQPKEGGSLQLNGSAATIEADSREEVIKLLKEDIYATSGVWDIESAQIIPWRTAVRDAL